ncbi:GNAT family N-acetyltransferase [Aminiphilus circumscriptus]|uniref:GNAT family N-acetyltransferase n=1 Tax=Aminiphilus circumscriptus TaxID=290732 RepID=UPI0004ADCCFE|nr:GNAT family protein [Aminiphilus circumscriptus]
MDRLRKGAHVFLRRPVAADEDEFLALMRRSLEFLAPWIYPPSDGEAFRDYLRGRDGERDDGFFLCLNDTGEIAGVINLNAIVRRWFQSAYLGYYMGAPFAGRGFMTEGIGLVMSFAFGDLGLHRLEANIQPGNAASIALVRRCGFRKEGYSPRYLNVNGEGWKDHERWARLADDEA